MSILVLIVDYGVKPSDPNIGRLLELFSQPMFVAMKFTPSQTSNFNALYREALIYAASGIYSNLPVALVLANNVSVLDSRQMASFLTVAQSYNYDLVFLNQWNDACNKYKTVLAAIDDGPALKQTFEPNSVQGVLFTTISRDMMINTLGTNTSPVGTIFNGMLTGGAVRGLCFSPSLISLDINLVTDNNDYLKLNECRIIPNQATQSSRSFALVLFFLVVVFIIFLAVALIKVSPQPEIKS